MNKSAIQGTLRGSTPCEPLNRSLGEIVQTAPLPYGNRKRSYQQASYNHTINY